MKLFCLHQYFLSCSISPLSQVFCSKNPTKFYWKSQWGSAAEIAIFKLWKAWKQEASLISLTKKIYSILLSFNSIPCLCCSWLFRTTLPAPWFFVKKHLTNARGTTWATFLATAALVSLEEIISAILCP